MKCISICKQEQGLGCSRRKAILQLLGKKHFYGHQCLQKQTYSKILAEMKLSRNYNKKNIR